MGCRCQERKDWLADREIAPIFGNAYTPVDAARYVVERVLERYREKYR